jgi:YVTN family beta-propeller protein
VVRPNAIPSRLLAVFLLAGCRSDPHWTVTSEWVGSDGSGRVVLPVNQILTPAGTQVDLPGMRPQVLALSPDHALLVTSGKTNVLVTVNPRSGRILQRVPFPSDKATDPAPQVVSSHILEPDTKGQVSYTGLAFSPDGSRIFLSSVNGDVKVFGVGTDQMVRGLYSIPLPPANVRERKEDIPSGLAVSRDGARLYVTLNFSNRLGEVDVASSKVLRLFDVGVAPYDVVLAGTKAYVTNWGGRRPDATSTTGPAGRGTLVRVDPVRHIASEGSVSVIDLAADTVKAEILVGLHSSGLALAPNGRRLFVANAGSDTVSVIDTVKDEVVETISLKWHPGDYFGASPNALVLDERGETLFVCNGTQNAVAVVSLGPWGSKVAGLIPVGWFPGAIAYDPIRKALGVANIKGIGSGKRPSAGEATRQTSGEYNGSVSIVKVPNRDELVAHTNKVLENYRASAMEVATFPPRPDRAPLPVPERAGEPSVFQHVVYIIKENRTYDQVLGDMKGGNGAESLCIFGEEVTPNQHKLAREFVLLDNAYCSGVVSADGHQWATAAFVTDYLEKSFAGFPRSYPDGMEDDDVDAIAYAPSGFIWDSAIAQGKTLRDYGEFAISDRAWKDKSTKGAPKWIDCYRDFIGETSLVHFASRPAIESLRPYLAADTVGWDMEVPDVFRAAVFIRELERFEKTGTFPNLVIICLPNDHTSGTNAGSPTPAAYVSDNDVALGRIVEAISHGRFWKETCIFVIEDDPQDGWDHVSAYRTTAYVASPYTKRGQVVSTQYNQTGIIRTIELILGLPPMNLFDATATPLGDCFTTSPDFTPFDAVPNRIPLDRLNPAPAAISDPLLREQAIASADLPLEKVDQCPEDLLNRILWHAMKGSGSAYPAWACRASRP